MPQIEQYDWSKLQPESGKQFIKQDFSKFKIKTIAKKKKPAFTRHTRKKKRLVIKDSRLFNDIYDQDQHLKSI